MSALGVSAFAPFVEAVNGFLALLGGDVSRTQLHRSLFI